jgi:holo-[acyl-carrier protein] synthase
VILGIGLDLTEIERFEFSAAQSEWFGRRIFTSAEMRYAQSKKKSAQHFAGSFAAKEAFRKAYGDSVPWRSMGVVHAASGAPEFALTPDLQAELAAKGVANVRLSITHSKGHAAAMVIFES